jgi:hypothetical protein
MKVHWRLIFWIWCWSQKDRDLLYAVRLQVHVYFDRWHYAIDNHLLQGVDTNGCTFKRPYSDFSLFLSILTSLPHSLLSSYEVLTDYRLAEAESVECD